MYHDAKRMLRSHFVAVPGQANMPLKGGHAHFISSLILFLDPWIELCVEIFLGDFHFHCVISYQKALFRASGKRHSVYLET